MRLAQRAHGGYKRANILIIFRTANSEPCFLGLLSVTPENGACQHPVPLPTCFRTDSPRPSSPGPSQQGPQSLPVPRLPSRSDPLRSGPFFPGRFLPSRLLPGRFAPFGSHSGLRTISFRPSAGSFQRQLAVGPSSPTNRLMAVRGLRPVRVAGGRRNCRGTIFVRPSSPLIAPCPVSAPRRIQNLVPRSVPTPRSCGKSVTNAESFEQFRGREVTACGGIFPDFATVLHGFGTRIGPDLSGTGICGCNPKFIPTNRPSSVPQGLSPFQIRPLPSVKRRQGSTIPNREL